MTLEELIEACVASGTVTHFKGHDKGSNAGGGQEFTAHLTDLTPDRAEEIKMAYLQDGVRVWFAPYLNKWVVKFRRRSIYPGRQPFDVGPVLKGYELMERAIELKGAANA